MARVLQFKDSGFAVSIEAGCNGVEATIVLIAAICAFPAKLARPPHRHWLGVSRHTGAEYRAYHQPVLSGQLESRIFFLDTPLSLAGPDHAGRSGGLYRLPALPVETDTASGDCGWLNNITCGSFCCSYSLF